jgi:hypothetical protein
MAHEALKARRLAYVRVFGNSEIVVIFERGKIVVFSIRASSEK